METNHKTRRVLITGCGGDLGFALCKLFSKTPNTIVIGTTRSTQLESTKAKFQRANLPKDKVFIEPLDFDTSKLRRRLFAIRQKYGFIDTVINNAGYILVSSIEDYDPKKTREVMNVNYHIPIQICAHFVKEMKAVGEGTIVNIASACTFVSIPTHGLYAASKSALEAATRALQLEVKGCGVSVYCAQPGLIRNKAYENAVHVNRSHSETYGQVENILEGFRNQLASSSEYVASRILEIVDLKPKKLAIRVTHDSVMLHFARKIASSPFVFSLIYYASLFIGKVTGVDVLAKASHDPTNVLSFDHYRTDYHDETQIGSNV